MENLPMCRMCLADNVRMHLVSNRHLQEIYEKLTNIPFNMESNRPLLACFMCYARLKKCQQFTMTCLHSEEVFMQMLIDYERKSIKSQIESTTNGYSAPVQYISFVVNNEVEESAAKHESLNAKTVEGGVLNKEQQRRENNDFGDTFAAASESEDDVPLTIYKTDVQEENKKRSRVRKRRKHDLLKCAKLDGTEIILTKQHQIENLVARFKSLDYMNSPFKCELCYKGFADTTAYKNHTINHNDNNFITKQTESRANGLTKTRVQHTSFGGDNKGDIDTVQNDVPGVIEKSDNDKLEKENRCNGSELENPVQYSDCENYGAASDSEDDVPLKKIKTSVEENIKKRTKFKKKGKDEMKSLGKIDAHEIILSKEQQIESLVARSKSVNYMNCPYKCELCFKGYVDTQAYNNHKIKHDERSGAHECEICHMRYRTERHLRTHAVTAHTRIFKCNKCGHASHTANQARVHDKWHAGHTYECQLCSQTFSKPTSYLSHLRKRHPTEHVCNVCGESFVGKHGLQMHKSKTHRNDVKQENAQELDAPDRFCSDCNIQFCNLEAWKRHILRSVKHTLRNEHNSQCTICGWHFTGNVSRKTHMKEHVKTLQQSRKQTKSKCRGDSHLRCTQCGMNFVTKSKLQAHVNRTHLGLKYNKNIVCEVCGKKCTSNATLRYHQRTHTGEKPYSCTSCSKQFSDSNQLRIHTRTHTGEKPYVCAVCGKRFSQKPALNRHYRVHTGAKPYICQYCARTFSQSNSLKVHIKTVHLKQPASSRKTKTRDTTEEAKENTKDEQELLTV